MTRITRAILASALLATTSLLPGSAANACSDLPNICASNAAHHQQTIDYWATPPWPDDEGDYYDDGPSYNPVDWEQLRRDMAFIAEVEVQRKAEAEALLQEKLKDAKFAAFWNGEWVAHDSPADAPGKFCSAMFLWRGQGALLLGPGGAYDGAFLAFFGPDIPAPKKIEKLKVTLAQTDDKPAMLTEFNMALPWAEGYGMLLFYVPSAEALLDGVLDTQWFRVTVNEKALVGRIDRPIAELEWNSASAARDKMRACLDAKSG